MRKVVKKTYIILGVFIVCLIVFSAMYILSNKNVNEERKEIQDNTTNDVNTNTVETNNVANENSSNDIETQNSVSVANLENSTQKNVTDKKEEVQKKTTNKENTQKNKIVQTKEKEASPIDIPKSNIQVPSTSTTQKDENKNADITPQKPTETTKITDKQLENEKAKYLQDIKAIKPGLKYQYQKRGYVFWPYRTNEISVGVGSVTFGTIYYYVEIFVDGTRERFRYYIDWAG